MKTNIKLLALILALTMLLSAALVGCNTATPPDGGNSDVSSEAPAGSNLPEETDPPSGAPEEYSIVSGGKSNFKIVRPANLTSDDISVKVAIDIRKAINNAVGVSLELGDDWLKDGAAYDGSTFEILVGNTGYPETAEVMAELNYGQYAVKAVGNKIVVFSYTESGYSKALGKLQILIRENTVKADDGTKNLTISAEALNVINNTEKMTATLPIFEGGKFSSVTDMGDGCYGLIIKSTNTDAYNAYVKKLTDKGFKTHATNEIAGSHFATLYNDEYTINAGFYNNMDEVRVIIEPYRDCTLAPLKSDAAPVTTTQLTMIGVEGIYNGSYQQNGLCLVYRLSTGEFVIVDGGHHGNSGIYASNIIKTLREQSKDYAKTDKDITIAAWIITHPHTDHHGTLLNEYKQFTKFNFKGIMCNFWSESDFNTAKNTTSSFATGSFAGYYKSASIAKEIGVDFYAPHVGQVYWFGDTAFEFLYTIESYLPKVATGFNTCSLVFRTITTDKSGKSTSVMVTGDATGHAFAVCNKMYRNELKCDVVQVAHHGGGTGGANGDTQSAYGLMKPSVILWPVGANYFPTVEKNTYNHALLEGKNPNFKELYVAGWQGNAVTLPLPYTIGTSIKNNVVEPK